AGEVLRSGRVGRPLRSGRFARALRAPLRIGLLAGIVASCGDSTAPPVASELAVVGGDGQSGVAAQPLPQAVAVVVRAGAGQPISGAPVDFEVTSGGGSVLPASVTSDAQGEARAVWTLGTDIALPQRLQATSGPASDLAEATARAGAPTTLELVDGEDQT